MLLKRHSGNSWRSTEELGGSSGTLWRARRGTQPSWRGGGAWKERMGKRRVEMMRRGPRIFLGKVRRRGLCHLPSVRLVVLFLFYFNCYFIFCDLNVWVRKSRKWNEKKFWKEILKSAWKLRVSENKQTEYTKESMKEITIGKCAETGDKCNSVIRTKREDRT